MEEKNKIRTRIAPSPTGFMHIGTLRTALTNYLFAKKNKGEFIIRLEDTDRKRFVKDSQEDLLKSLRWAGLEWTEGIDLDPDGNIIEKGSYGPYIQSKRLPIYKKHVQELIDQGWAYYCFCSPSRLEEMRKKQEKKGEPPRYDGHCRNLPPSVIKEKLKQKENYVIRLRVPREVSECEKLGLAKNKDQEPGWINFTDLVRGETGTMSNLLDDQILFKSDGYPTYHLAVVIDDHLMKITHILRGEEWLPSAPKHILLYKAFGWEIPQYGHLPQLLNLNGKKLSKRDGDVAVRDFVKKGYLPEALINFIALLGWNPKTTQEIFSLKELIEQFDLKKINKSGSRFDYNRLNWFNSYYLKKKSTEELLVWGRELWKQKDPKKKETFLDEKKLHKILLTQQKRAGDPSQIFAEVAYLIEEKIIYPKELLVWQKMSEEEIVSSLEKSLETLDNIDKNDYKLKNIEQNLLEAAGEKRGELLWPLRVALTGEKKSPSPFECAWILGKEESQKRIKEAINLIKSS